MKHSEEQWVIATELPPFLGTTQSFDFLPREWQTSLAVAARAKFRIRKWPELGGLPLPAESRGFRDMKSL
jgi:hypothetical protein